MRPIASMLRGQPDMAVTRPACCVLDHTQGPPALRVVLMGAGRITGCKVSMRWVPCAWLAVLHRRCPACLLAAHPLLYELYDVIHTHTSSPEAGLENGCGGGAQVMGLACGWQ